MVLKINVKKLLVELDEVKEDINFEEVAEDLPEAVPQYLIFSFKMQHAHDRVSFPLVFLFYCPSGINPKLNMLYASTKTRLMNKLEIVKSLELRDRKEFSEEWLRGKVSGFQGQKN